MRGVPYLGCDIPWVPPLWVWSSTDDYSHALAVDDAVQLADTGCTLNRAKGSRNDRLDIALSAILGLLRMMLALLTYLNCRLVPLLVTWLDLGGEVGPV